MWRQLSIMMPAPGEAGLVPYLQRGQCRSAAAVFDDALHEALQGMEAAVGRAAVNGDGIQGDGQAVAFAAQGFVFRKGNVRALFNHCRFDAVFPEKALRLYGKGVPRRKFHAAVFQRKAGCPALNSSEAGRGMMQGASRTGAEGAPQQKGAAVDEAVRKRCLRFMI